ncbi:hypothetical protein DICPUDRAFT_36211, partial [Dictyostelium purpureum]
DFCSPKLPYLECDTQNNVVKLDFENYPQTSNEIIQNTDISCIGPKFKWMSTNNWNIANNFFDFENHFEYPIKSNEFSVTLKSRVEEPILLSKLAQPLKSLCYFLNHRLDQNKYSVYINNDLINTPSDPLSFIRASFVTRNIPSMANIKGTNIITYFLGEDFDHNSFSNLSTHNQISKLSIEGGNYPMFPLSILLNMEGPTSDDNSYLYRYNIQSPTEFIDFSGKTSISSISFAPASDFHVKGEFPFSKLPNGIQFFDYNIGNLKKLPDYRIFDYTDIYYFSCYAHPLTQDLPKWDGSKNNITTLMLSQNLLTGTIDESYCSVILIVYSNLLTGLIPECFTCHFAIPSFKSYFYGNSFDNYDTIGTCKTIPKLKYKNETILLRSKYITAPILSLVGQNVGYSSDDIQSNPYVDFYYLEKANSKFFARSYSLNRIIHTIKFASTGQEFTLTPDPYPPLLSNITSNNHILVFKGLYYSYDITEITITIGDKSCDVTDSTFYQITCTLTTYPNQLNNVSGTLKVDQLQTTFNLNLDNNDGNEVFNNYTSCPDNCESYNGNICNYNTGICECSDVIVYQNGITWKSFNFFVYQSKQQTCLNNCIDTNHGICNTSNGICECKSGWTGFDCIFNSYTSCPDNCESYNGNICNYNTGICECPKDWTGENCYTPKHYVSSITPTYEDGGLVTMNGWLGDIHQNLKVTIGNQECKIDTISSNTITCNIGAGTGKKDVIVYQNGITWKSFNFFVYQSKQQTCLNNCIDTNHGICNTSNGICECKSGWTGFDCSSPSNNNNNNNGNTNSTVNPDGSTTINNDQTTYNILITSLLELDINSDTVKQYPLQNNWNVTSNDKNGSNVTFTQILNETECQIVLSIQEIENDIQYSFAGLEFKLDKGSIKVSVSIHNYNYQSPLNTLQLQMISNVSDTTSNDCNSKSASTSTSILDNQTLNYISINKDNKILYGRFINRAISDGHTTLITTSLVSSQNESITIGINIPHCRTSCYIDPDFSVLINSNFKSNCDESKNHTTLIAVLISCIGAAVIIILAGAYYLLYKKSTKTKIIVFKLKKKIKMAK